MGATTPWRQNYDPTCEVGCNFWLSGRGYDINRYHSFAESAYDNPYVAGEDTLNEVPEAIAMRLLWDELQPVVMVDYHHQGTYVDDDGRMITGSIMWPNAVNTAAQLGISEEFAETITESQRAASVMLQAVDSYGYANITRYPSTTTPGIARNAYGLLGLRLGALRAARRHRPEVGRLHLQDGERDRLRAAQVCRGRVLGDGGPLGHREHPRAGRLRG